GLRLHLGGVLGGLLRGRDVVDLDLDARVLGEAGPDLRQFLVGERREVVPAKVRDLALLPARGRDAGREDPGEARRGRGRELVSGQRWLAGSCCSRIVADTDLTGGRLVFTASTTFGSSYYTGRPVLVALA